MQSSSDRLLPFSSLSPRLRARAERDAAFFSGSGLLVSGSVRVEELARPTVAIVGSRRPTSYGLCFVREFVPRLKGLGWNVASGGALGIDGEVHAAALRAGVATQAYLVGPLARPSPRSHDALFRELREREGCGLLVPESLEPAVRGRGPVPADWLARNQWLVASADVLVVVEARIPSGTWSSVRLANGYAMPVYALPGPVSSPLSSGTNAMIARGFAHMIEGAEALVALLCAELGASAPPAASSVGSDPLRQLFSSSSPLDLAELLEAGRTRGLGELQILEGVERLLESGELVKSGFYLEWRGAL